MQKIVTTLVLMTFLLAPAYADDDDSSVDSVIEDIWGGDSDKGHKGQGRPENPGEQGRENAAQKQRENPGKGSKGNDEDESWVDEIRDDIEGDDGNDEKKSQKQSDKQNQKQKAK
jgi:hypothetical protein